MGDRKLKRLRVYAPKTGDRGVRDPEHPCSDFEPGAPSERGQCMTDGHYMCHECVHIDPWQIERLQECGCGHLREDHGWWPSPPGEFCSAGNCDCKAFRLATGRP